MERKTKYIIIAICCVFGIILGSTTAWYTWTSSENTDVTFTIGGVTVNYEAGPNISKNLRPTSSKEIGVERGYAIEKEITVSSDKNALFDLYITASLFPSVLSHESFRWEIYEEEDLLNRGSFAGLEVGESITVLDQIEINNTVKILKLYIWIDGNMENPSSMAGQNYKFTLSASVTGEGISTYKDPSGANAPELMSGMVPVEYLTITEDEVEEDGWYVADETTEWYNYGNKEWANAVLVTEESELREAEAGTKVLEEDVLAYYVWIPRYSYELFNVNKKIGEDSYNARYKGIHINFENKKHTTGITDCTISPIGEETCINAENGNYYTHPAFWWDSNDNGVRETSEELTGIWVGKFEISSETPDVEYGGGNSTTLSVRIKPNVYTWSYNRISNFFTVIQNMMNDGNEYGINSDETDSHMIKNIEWGAVAYLTHSIYGICNETGCGTVKQNDMYYEEGLFAVKAGEGNYVKNIGLSTTNNIYGIYDMSGGCWENVMGNMISSDGKTMLNGSYHDGITGEIEMFELPYPPKRYYDVYAYGTTEEDQEAYSRGHLGDATGEVIYLETYGGSDNILYTWKEGASHFVSSGYPWLARVGTFEAMHFASIFGFHSFYSAPHDNNSTRAVLVAMS